MNIRRRILNEFREDKKYFSTCIQTASFNVERIGYGTWVDGRSGKTSWSFIRGIKYEIDLHLHPSWQQRVLGDLMHVFPKVQFIVSTHAPAVLHSVKSENLVILKECQVLGIHSEIYGNDVKSILSEVMEVTDRPPKVAEMFDHFYQLLRDKDYDQAEQVLDEIDKLRDYHDQEVAGCRVKLKLERIRGGQL